MSCCTRQRKQAPSLSLFCQATRQSRVDRKLSKLNSNDMGTDILNGSWMPAPWFVKSNTMQSSGVLSRFNRTFARLCTACLGNRRLSCMFTISIFDWAIIQSLLWITYSVLPFGGWATYKSSTKSTAPRSHKIFGGIRAASITRYREMYAGAGLFRPSRQYLHSFAQRM